MLTTSKFFNITLTFSFEQCSQFLVGTDLVHILNDQFASADLKAVSDFKAIPTDAYKNDY
jgi:hypothetical protein